MFYFLLYFCLVIFTSISTVKFAIFFFLTHEHCWDFVACCECYFLSLFSWFITHALSYLFLSQILRHTAFVKLLSLCGCSWVGSLKFKPRVYQAIWPSLIWKYFLFTLLQLFLQWCLTLYLSMFQYWSSVKGCVYLCLGLLNYNRTIFKELSVSTHFFLYSYAKGKGIL